MKSKKFRRWLAGAVALTSLAIAATACSIDTDTDSQANQERDRVNEQQATYAENQPIPHYDWSLSRHLWIQFYDAQNRVVTTFSYISGLNGGAPTYDCASQGYALPRDTQLTAPTAKLPNHELVVDQAEPNGLFTSKNTDATIVFCQNPNGSLAPVYTEHKVDAFPFPVQWVIDENHPQGHFVRVGDSNINLNPNR